jgi:hypothetical protein
MRWRFYWQRTKRYQQINPMNDCDKNDDENHHDLALTEEQEE